MYYFVTCEISELTISTTCINVIYISVLIKYFACYWISLGLKPAYDNMYQDHLLACQLFFIEYYGAFG